MKKTIFIILIVILSFINFVSAEFWACFSQGEVTDYCNPKVIDRTCASSNGCKRCMSSYNEELGCYNQGNWNTCNGLEDQGCSIAVGGETSIDSEPPELTLISPSPLNDSLFTSRSISLIFTLNEKADVYYYDNINGRGRWVRICYDCYDYNKRRSFREGYNDITFQSVDVVGNEAFTSVSFFIDSKKPRMGKTEPRRGFVASEFYVEFREENPKSLVLNYGNNLAGFREQEVDLGSCYEPRRDRSACDVEVDLSDYDGQTVEYWYVLEDIVGNIAESRHNFIQVDETSPVIDYIDYTIKRRSVTFNIGVTEENLGFVEYIDNTASRPRWRRLCSRLRDGVCVARKSFSTGSHLLSIQVTDKAGNAVGESFSFTI